MGVYEFVVWGGGGKKKKRCGRCGLGVGICDDKLDKFWTRTEIYGRGCDSAKSKWKII
jgi:hypothetical protein